MSPARLAAWSALAGVFIPVMAVLNARLGRALGEPLHAPVVLFAVGLAIVAISAFGTTGTLPSPTALVRAAPADFAGGAIVAFYIVSVTLLAPRFGVGNTILFVMTAQLFSSAVIDHFGLFGAALRRMTPMRAAGLALLLAGLWLTQVRGDVAGPVAPE